jgi:hypothetical protein
MPADRCAPIAGIIREEPDPRDVGVNSVVREDVKLSPSPTWFGGSSAAEPNPKRLSIINPNAILTGDSSDIGRELPPKTFDKAGNPRPHKGNASRRLGERHQKPATRASSRLPSGKLNLKGLC